MRKLGWKNKKGNLSFIQHSSLLFSFRSLCFPGRMCCEPGERERERAKTFAACLSFKKAGG